MIKVCLFDLDGTVVDTNKLIFESFKYTMREYNISDISDETIYSFFGEPLIKSMERVAGVIDAPNMVQTYREYNENAHDEMINEFPHVVETLDYLKSKGYRLGIVTSKRSEMARRSLNRLNLEDYFELIVTPEDTILHKPNKEPVEFALNHFMVTPEEAIMVGDSPYDLLSGKAAGTYTCGVKYTKLDPQKLEETDPDYMITDMSKLIPVIEEIDSKVNK